MDRINFFKQTIVAVFKEYATYLKGTQPNFSIDFQVIEDSKNNHFQLVVVGWEGDNRIYYVVFQADIINQKIWIQEDNTEDGLAALLENKGVNKKEMVLGYFPEYHRKYTEYAVA